MLVPHLYRKVSVRFSFGSDRDRLRASLQRIIIVVYVFAFAAIGLLGVGDWLVTRYQPTPDNSITIALPMSFLRNGYPDLLACSVLLLLPLSTVLSAMLWQTTENGRRPGLAVTTICAWLILRLNLVGVLFLGLVPEVFDLTLTPQIHQQPGQIYHRPGDVFGGVGGLTLCSLGVLMAFVIGVKGRGAIGPKTLIATVGACLSPMIALLFASSKLVFGILTIDMAITALTFGWLLSNHRGSMDGQAITQEERTASNLCDGYSETRRKQRILQPFGLFVGDENRVRYMVKGVGGLLFATIFPAILLKWAFHNAFGLPLNGDVASWIAIWSVVCVLSLFTYILFRNYNRPDRAILAATAAFLCAFSIMVHMPINPIGNILVDNILLWSIIALANLGLTSTVILVVGTSALFATIAFDVFRWTRPFWAGYLFIYIFTHSFANSGYANDLSKLDLFSWVNMSVIVFVFLFAIPIYFANEGVRPQHVTTTPKDPAK